MSRISPHPVGWVINTQNGLHLTIWKIWTHQSTLWTCTSTCIFSGTHDRCLEGFSFHCCIHGWYNHLQQDSRGSLNHIRQVFEKIWNVHLSMKLGKCHFFANEIQYLGHILSTTGTRSLPWNAQAINNMHPPITAKQVLAFLGLVGYYRKFIKGIAKMAKLLTLSTPSQGQVWMDTSAPYSLHDAEGSHYTSTYLMLPWSSKEIHIIHRCIGWCIWSTTITGTWWNWISSSLTCSLKNRGNGVPQNRNPTEYTTPLSNGITTFKELMS